MERPCPTPSWWIARGAARPRLRALGYGSGSGQRVGLIASNTLDYVVVAVAACQLAQVTVVPLPGMLTPDSRHGMAMENPTGLARAIAASIG